MASSEFNTHETGLSAVVNNNYGKFFLERVGNIVACEIRWATGVNPTLAAWEQLTIASTPTIPAIFLPTSTEKTQYFQIVRQNTSDYKAVYAKVDNTGIQLSNQSGAQQKVGTQLTITITWVV